MKKKFSIIVVNFFRVTNPYSGASEVSYNFFKNIPIKNKSPLMKKINQMPRLHSLIENIDVNIDNNKNYKKYSFALECLDNEGIILDIEGESCLVRFETK